jgi:hypothetical protein
MSDQPKLGDFLDSPVSNAQFLVIDPGTAVSMPTVGDVPLVRGGARPCSAAVEPAGQCELEGGRRYVDAARGLTLLCVWPGAGLLRHEGVRLSVTDDHRVADQLAAPASGACNAIAVALLQPDVAPLTHHGGPARPQPDKA